MALRDFRRHRYCACHGKQCQQVSNMIFSLPSLESRKHSKRLHGAPLEHRQPFGDGLPNPLPNNCFLKCHPPTMAPRVLSVLAMATFAFPDLQAKSIVQRLTSSRSSSRAAASSRAVGHWPALPQALSSALKATCSGCSLWAGGKGPIWIPKKWQVESGRRREPKSSKKSRGFTSLICQPPD